MSIELNATTLNVLSPASRPKAATPERVPQSEVPSWERLRASESKLLDTPTETHVSQYLDAVKELLNHALRHHQAESGTYWSPKGRFRQMVRIVQVNQGMDLLLQSIRDNRPATVVVQHLDAIRGLLLDLFL